MKKIVISMLAIFATVAIEAQQTIALPEPNMKVGMTLMEALELRHSEREYSNQDISLETLSQVLWAACGINRPESNMITAPSAINAQDIIVFVCTSRGAYRYEPKGHKLIEVSRKDLRSAVAGRQQFAASAPIALILASDHSHFGNRQQGAERMGAIDSGYVSENISLVCTALGLCTVPRMTMDNDVLKAELGLNDSFDLLLNHPIGYRAH